MAGPLIRIRSIARRLRCAVGRPSEARPAARVEPASAPPLIATPGIRQDLDPRDWRNHHFGLPPARWEALEGRIFWITGAGTGFGRSVAVALAAAGCRVALTGRSPEKLHEAIREMAAYDIPVENSLPVPADLTREADVLAAIDGIMRAFGALDGLVHCAALPQAGDGPAPLMSVTAERWEHMLATNVTSAWLVGRAALAAMLPRERVRMILLTSEAGWASTPGHGPYNVTKSALNTLGASFAAECAARHPHADVQINILNPGEARTEMNRGSATSPYTAACMTLVLLSHPAGGPNGCFFHRDGRHLNFAYSPAYQNRLL
jgi:gluconate 5-dehydrogenase